MKVKRSTGATLSSTSALDSGWVVNVTPQLLYPRERNSVPFELEAVCAPGSLWAAADNRPPPLGFDPLAVQPVARHYID